MEFGVKELLNAIEKEVDDAKEFISAAFLASSAAKEERADIMISLEELEAVSLSATSAAIAAVDFFVICSGLALAKDDGVDGLIENTRSSSNCLRMLAASST